ncbi:claudin-15 isoform X3 [Eumetopias jubatus]|uniref:claudin-15 isoform X3 n=1 Tax=Eumetopias jubatus TaxID=34886 RepID=UPI00101718FC|nr:claudin-15 isoform X3 [Eumetopias jubatus]
MEEFSLEDLAQILGLLRLLSFVLTNIQESGSAPRTLPRQSLPLRPNLAKAPQVLVGLSPSPSLGPPAPLGALHPTMSVAVETFGFFMAALGLLMLGVTLPHSYWRVSTVHGSVITTNTIFENLWFSCATDSMGVYNCREFPSLLALSGYIQACRALMITAIFLGFLGLFLGMVGLRCVNIGSMDLSRKAKLAATAGALHILAGFCGMVAISWYAFNITQEFFDPVYAGTKYELGPALYLGWSASLLAILGGLCLGSGCCRSPDAAPAPRLPYEASAVRSPGLTDHLRPAASDEGDSTFGKYGKNAYV